jgi:hypothetical protein
MRKTTTVGEVSKYDLKLTTKASNWRVGGLVGSCVSGLVGGMAKRNWYWAHTEILSHQNRLLFFEMEWKRVTWRKSTTNVQYSI